MKRTLTGLFVALFALVLLSACGSDAPATEESTPAPADIPAEEPVDEAYDESHDQSHDSDEPVVDHDDPGTESGDFAISSPSYADGAAIPDRYACFGDNVSPAVNWSNVPTDAASLLIFMYDPDADMAMGASVSPGFVHWIVYNVPPDTTGFGEGVPAGVALEGGAMQGSNDFAQYESPGAVFPGGASVKLIGYDGPCPPEQHRYVIAVYALDTLLDVPADATPGEILDAMQGHVIDEAQWSGVYDPPL